MGAALHEQGTGHLITIDNDSAKEREPEIESLLEATGLSSYVTPIYSQTSYSWELRALLEQHQADGMTQPIFDFCFIDGAHAWEPDGFAFFLVEKLLKPGGWILFDDLDWTYASSPGLRGSEFVRAMPVDYKTTAHIERVWSLLVTQHSNFHNFRREGRWGWAEKKGETSTQSRAALDSIYLKQSISADGARLLKKIVKRIVRRS